MPASVVGRATIPDHLPERLTISFWFGCWATDVQPGEGFADLDQALGDLVARGFNTIRIDGLWSWCFRPDGTPRGPVEIGNVALPGTCDYGPGLTTRGGVYVDVLQRLFELLALAQKHNVYVALTSWEYQPGHTLGFLADPALRQEILAIPVPDRFPYAGQQIDRLLTAIKREGFGDRLAYVEFHNEIDSSIGLGLPGGRVALRSQSSVVQAITRLSPRYPVNTIMSQNITEPGEGCSSTFKTRAGWPRSTKICSRHRITAVTARNSPRMTMRANSRQSWR